MALILSLETSGPTCSVALHEDGALIESARSALPQNHAAALSVLVRELCQSASVKITSVKAVSVSAGPGSYTGLRIGTSTAKGLCVALNVPLISISTLQLLAFEARDRITDQGLLCPMIDAKRMEVYCEVFDLELNRVCAPEAMVIDSNSFAELLTTQSMFFFGDGAEKCRTVLNHENANFIPGILPTAEGMGRLSFERYTRQQFEDLVNFTPFYLKDFIAKRAASPL